MTSFQRKLCISHVFENGMKDFHCSRSVAERSTGLQGEHSQDGFCDVMVKDAFSASFLIWGKMHFCREWLNESQDPRQPAG